MLLGEIKNLGDLCLFFGCRKKNCDYIYREELEKAHSEGFLKYLYIAFSREQEKKVYVQDLMEENKEQILDFIFSNNASIYICG